MHMKMRVFSPTVSMHVAMGEAARNEKLLVMN